VFDTPDFLRFWRWVTPIDEISRLRIGSRPATRRSGAVNPGHIRAIPWVFSWLQSRFNLPGWYGMGQAFAHEDVDLAQLQEMYQRWSFFQVLVDSAELSLVKANMGQASLYISLAQDEAVALALFEQLRDAFALTRQMILAVTQRDALLAQIEARNQWLRPLHQLQVETLRRLRALPDDETTESTQLRDIMFQTFNGIAAGLRSTG